MPRIPLDNELIKVKEEALLKDDRFFSFIPAYSNSDYNTIKWNSTEQAVELVSSSDDTIGMATEAFRVDKIGAKFSIDVDIKGSAASDTGCYIRIYEYNTDLPNGIRHISNSATNPLVQEDTSGKSNIYENDAITTDWKKISYIYTPTAGAKWASFVILNWTDYGSNSLYVKKPRIFDITDTTAQLNSKVSNTHLTNQRTSDCDAVATDGINFKHSTSSATNKPVGTNHALMTQSYDVNWSTQLASDWRTNNWLVRTQNNGTWGTWKALIKEGDTATDSTKFASRDIGQRTFLDNMKRAITGGGTITYTSDYYLKWTKRFISIAVAESSTTASSGHFNIDMPPADTVIHGVGSQDDVTVNASGIYLKYWSSLWYEPVLGSDSTSQDGNFHISYYNKIDGVVIPDHWILVANTNGDTSDNGGGYTARLCNGKSIKSGTNLYPDTAWIYPTLENSWVNYDSNYGNTRYKRVNNVVIIEGLVKDGTISSSGSVFTLPVGFRPRGRLLGATTSDNSHARIDITTDGKVVPYSGSDSWYSVWCTFSVT